MFGLDESREKKCVFVSSGQGKSFAPAGPLFFAVRNLGIVWYGVVASNILLMGTLWRSFGTFSRRLKEGEKEEE